jgi:hypothetical protein
MHTNRPLHAFKVASVSRANDETILTGEANGRMVSVEVTPSGEFRLLGNGDAVRLNASDLRDVSQALSQYQRQVPWKDSAARYLFKAVNDAAFPTSFNNYEVRNVSRVGPNILLTGKTPREQLDVALHVATGELKLFRLQENGCIRRELSTQEAWDLACMLVDVAPTNVLLGALYEAVRKHAQH